LATISGRSRGSDLVSGCGVLSTFHLPPSTFHIPHFTFHILPCTLPFHASVDTVVLRFGDAASGHGCADGIGFDRCGRRRRSTRRELAEISAPANGPRPEVFSN
jgi:hypothetical protein